VLGGGLEPHFRVPFSTIFHGIALESANRGRKRWKAVEAKLLQTAASLRTFFVLVISAEALKSLVAFLGHNPRFDRLWFMDQLAREWMRPRCEKAGEGKSKEGR
jgi:phosphoribosyl-dephospho-CoA transferase